MDTEKELNTKIMAITMLIAEKYPELSKFLNEMPETIPDESNPEINTKILQEYYDSLSDTLKKYMAEHLAASVSEPEIKV